MPQCRQDRAAMTEGLVNPAVRMGAYAMRPYSANQRPLRL